MSVNTFNNIIIDIVTALDVSDKISIFGDTFRTPEIGTSLAYKLKNVFEHFLESLKLSELLIGLIFRSDSLPDFSLFSIFSS